MLPLAEQEDKNIVFVTTKSSKFMLHFIELVIALSIILLIVPQTPTENIVLRKLLETGFFTNYSKAKQFLSLLTWVLIFVFLILLIFLNFKLF